MATAPQTWNVLTSIQATIQNEVKVGGVSPYTPFIPGDATAYGATNAIYVGVPKDFKPLYTAQCWVVPPTHQKIYRRANGGPVFEEDRIQITHLFLAKTGYYAQMQACVNATDALTPVLLKHCDTTWGATVYASWILEDAGVSRYYYTNDAGEDWLAWGTTLVITQRYVIPGGFVA